MRQESHTIQNIADLEAVLSLCCQDDTNKKYKSILVQVFSASCTASWYQKISQSIRAVLSQATVIGASSIGEICNGAMQTGTTVISFSFFEHASLDSVVLPCQPGDESRIAAALADRLSATSAATAGFLLLTTPLTLNVSKVLSAIEGNRLTFPIFGGGAGVYSLADPSFVFCDTEAFSCGVVGIILNGDDLHIDARTYLGWRPLSKEMTITEVDGLTVKAIDGAPAFEVYQRYLGIDHDEAFFINVLEFPFLIRRNGLDIARVPVTVTEGGGLLFIADLEVGERFRIGYGDPSLIVANAGEIHQQVEQFFPDAIFLYTCGCRRFLMQDEADLETLPFQSIAPTAGFYTYGEVISHGGQQEALNSAMVTVAMREGPAAVAPLVPESAHAEGVSHQDPYAYQHSRIISRLVHFVDAVTRELEEANQDIRTLSITDQLTGLHNRRKLDEVLLEQDVLFQRHKRPFSILLLDIDHFKQVNDVHGHLVGDTTLIEFGKVLRPLIRSVDLLGRWGGEEFMIVLPETVQAEALLVAEKLRNAVAVTPFPVVGSKTTSIGVATMTAQDDRLEAVLHRADEALYKAKNLGRNRVCAV